MAIMATAASCEKKKDNGNGSSENAPAVTTTAENDVVTATKPENAVETEAVTESVTEALTEAETEEETEGFTMPNCRIKRICGGKIRNLALDFVTNV